MYNELLESLTVGRPSRPHAEADETAVVGDTCRIQVTKLAWQAPTDKSSVKPIRPEADLIAQGMDSLVAASYYNFTSSPLCRLPDELLLDIMELLDPKGLECLRRTSRIFLRLFGFSKFKSAHLTVHGSLEPTRIPWAETDPGMHCRYPDAMELLALLRKDRFCSRCLRVIQLKRKHKQFRSLVDKKLYCDGCKTKHPAGLFSATQRRMNWSWWKGSTRVCIAHEGYIRACQHVVIRWSDIESWVAQNGLDDTGEQQFLIPWTSICQERCHGFQCDRSTWCNGINLSIAKIQRGRISLEIAWVAHVATPSRASAVPTAETMRQIVESTHQDAAQFLVPQLSHGGCSPLMAAVGPNRCSCLQYAGHDKLDWQLSPLKDEEDSCRTDPELNLFSQTRRYRWTPYHHVGIYAPYVEGDFRYRQHFFGFISSCECTAIEILYRRTVDIGFDQAAPHRPSVGWYRAIEPESYGLAMDCDSRHVLWCPDTSCKNYYGLSYTNRFHHVL